MKAGKFFDGLQRCILAFFWFFVGCFVWFSISMLVLLGTIECFFLFFLGWRIDLLQAVLLHHDPSAAVFWNQEFFGVIHQASFGGAVLLGLMYCWDRRRKEGSV